MLAIVVYKYSMLCSDDFKPASVDTSQESSVEIGANNSVTVTVPHVEVCIICSG